MVTFLIWSEPLITQPWCLVLGKKLLLSLKKCQLAGLEIVSVSYYEPADGAKTWTSSPRTQSNFRLVRLGNWTNLADLSSLVDAPVGGAESNSPPLKLELSVQRPDLG